MQRDFDNYEYKDIRIEDGDDDALGIELNRHAEMGENSIDILTICRTL